MSLYSALPLGNNVTHRSQSVLQKYSDDSSPTIKRDLQIVESQKDLRIISDPKIEKFLDYVLKRYYRFWFYVRGIPKLAIPILITGCQRLLQNLYIKGCQTLDGKALDISACIVCNNDSTLHKGDTEFRYLNYIVIVFGILLLMTILRRGIAEAHLCMKMLKYKIFVRASWYYWDHILLIIVVGLVCATLSLISSVFLAKVNAEQAQITCDAGALEGTKIQLILSDFSDNLWFWIGIYAASVLAYWPIIDFLIDLYDTPLKIFIEPEDMFRLNGELKGSDKLFHHLSFVQQKVRLRYLLTEINLIFKELKKRRPFRVERVPDELLEVAILRLYNKGKMKEFKQKL